MKTSSSFLPQLVPMQLELQQLVATINYINNINSSMQKLLTLRVVLLFWWTAKWALATICSFLPDDLKVELLHNNVPWMHLESHNTRDGVEATPQTSLYVERVSVTEQRSRNYRVLHSLGYGRRQPTLRIRTSVANCGLSFTVWLRLFESELNATMHHVVTNREIWQVTYSYSVRGTSVHQTLTATFTITP